MYNLSKQHDTPNELQTFVKGKEHKNIPSITGYTNHKNESDKKKRRIKKGTKNPIHSIQQQLRISRVPWQYKTAFTEESLGQDLTPLEFVLQIPV